MAGTIWFAAGLLLIVSGWHWTAIETQVRSRTPQTSEHYRRVAIGYWIWNPDIPDRVRRQAVMCSFALSGSLLMAGVGAFASDRPDFSLLMVLGSAVSLFDGLSKWWRFRRQYRSDMR